MQGARTYLLPFLLFLMLTLPGIRQGDFRRDTGRYAAVGLQMWRDGPLLRPHLHPDVPYFRKPPLAVAAHGLSLRLFGARLIAARMPSVFAGLGTIALLMAWVRRFSGRAETLAAGCILALTYEFFRRTHEISLDMWMVLFVMISVYAFTRGVERDRWGWMTLAGIAGGLALLCKPLLALALIPVYAVWLIVWRRPRACVWLPWVLLWMLITAGPWYSLMIHDFGRAFLDVHFGHEVVARAKGDIDRIGPWYYLVEESATYWPWMLALIWGVVCWIRGDLLREGPEPSGPNRRDMLRASAAWIVLVTAGLSFFPDKAPNYFLPVYPFLAVIAAYGFCRARWARWRRWYASGLRGLAPAVMVVTVILCVLPITYHGRPDPDWTAFFQWLENHPVDVSRDLWIKNVGSNDWGRFYLHTGQWPRALRTHGEAFHRADKDGMYVVLFREPPPDNTAVFQSGKIAVVPAASL